MKRVLVILALLTALAALFFGLVPLIGYRIFHLGVLLLLLYGAGVILLLVFWDAFPDPLFPGYPKESVLWWRVTRRVLAGLLALAAAGGVFVSALMLKAGHMNPPPRDLEPAGATVVVLGCLVKPEGPSLMLQRRLDAAADYLLEHPGTPVVVAGGQGADEPMSEAQAMEAVLLQKGVEQERIFKEDRSSTTRENLAFSAQVIRENGLPERLVIVTDGYHQLRGAVYARAQGFPEAYAVSGRSPWGLVPSYWVREIPAIAQAVVLHGGSLW